MILESISKLILGGTANLSDSDGNLLYFKVVESESIGRSSSITSYAVESTGKNISDNMTVNPLTFSLKTILCDDKTLLDYVTADKFKTAAEKKARLESWCTSGTILTYTGPKFSSLSLTTSGLDVILSKLVITNIQLERSSETGGGFSLSLSFQQIMTADMTDSSGKAGALSATNCMGMQNTGIV